MPAEYKTVTKRVLRTPEQIKESVVPAKYKTITKRVLVKEGEYSDWREILCDENVNSNTYRQIQQALYDDGYDIGPTGVDGVFGAHTRAALLQYQRDNNLPVGNLNIETLNKLGVQ